MKKHLLIIVLSMYAAFAFGQQEKQHLQIPGKCLSYTVKGNQVTFHCENKAGVRLKLLGQSVVKVWYEPSGVFERKNPSFAVVNERLGKTGDIQVNEQAAYYEIYTDLLRIRIRKAPFQLQIFDQYQKLLLGDFEDQGLVKKGNGLASFKTLRPDEQFFGLGEKAGPLNRRGKSYTMWNSDKPCYSPFEDPLYKSIPFFMSSYRYGIFFDNTYKTAFTFGSQSGQYFSFEAPGGEMLYYFIYGKDYKQIIHRYMQLTGRPIMPPKWAFGFSQCRGYYTREKLARDIAGEFRKRNIPCDIIYQDIGWTAGLMDFAWGDGYTRPADMVSDLEEAGFKVIVSQDPVISQANKDQWAEADSLGLFVTDVRTGDTYDMPWPWGGNCGVVDFTDPSAANWWGNYQQKPIDDGVRGFWTDMGEPAWSNEEATDRLYMQHHAGSHAEIHNVYGLTWDKVVTEQFEKHNPDTRIFQMTRAGYAGMQRYTFGWSGDAGNGYQVSEGWGQLANQIPVGLSAGMGLIPFWSCDISGYCGDITDYGKMAELYARWMQFGVFNPLSRAHHEGGNAVEPWLFGPEVAQICREAIELKYQLFPYIYTYAREAYDTGMPLMRALLLEYPNDPETYGINGEFLFGEELLVAPVVEKGARSKKVYLPEGTWIDFNDKKTTYQGGRWITYPAPLDVIPLFVKKGAILPMMPVMQYIHEIPAYPVFLEIFPADVGQEASFELYEDDGLTNGYKKDIYSKTHIRAATGKDGYLIEIDKAVSGYQTPERNLILKVYLDKKPGSVHINTEKAPRIREEAFGELLYTDFDREGWRWDKDKGICMIKLPDDRTENKVRINQ